MYYIKEGHPILLQLCVQNINLLHPTSHHHFPGSLYFEIISSRVWWLWGINKKDRSNARRALCAYFTKHCRCPADISCSSYSFILTSSSYICIIIIIIVAPGPALCYRHSIREDTQGILSDFRHWDIIYFQSDTSYDMDVLIISQSDQIWETFCIFRCYLDITMLPDIIRF